MEFHKVVGISYLHQVSIGGDHVQWWIRDIELGLFGDMGARRSHNIFSLHRCGILLGGTKDSLYWS